jgi:hypothetical protein
MTDTPIDPPRRGRPPMLRTEPVNAAPEIQADTGPRHKPRKPFGAMTLKLAYPDRPGFHRHWFNDTTGRIQRAQEAGYEHVIADGKPMQKVVGTAEGGGPLVGFLMEIPEEWFREDMAAQQREIDDKEKAIKRGELESQEGDNRYVPATGIAIKRG